MNDEAVEVLANAGSDLISHHWQRLESEDVFPLGEFLRGWSDFTAQQVRDSSCFRLVSFVFHAEPLTGPQRSPAAFLSCLRGWDRIVQRADEMQENGGRSMEVYLSATRRLFRLVLDALQLGNPEGLCRECSDAPDTPTSERFPLLLVDH